MFSTNTREIVAQKFWRLVGFVRWVGWRENGNIRQILPQPCGLAGRAAAVEAVEIDDHIRDCIPSGAPAKKTGLRRAPHFKSGVTAVYAKSITIAVFASVCALVRWAAIPSAETGTDCLVRSALQLHQSQAIGVADSILPAAAVTASAGNSNDRPDHSQYRHGHQQGNNPCGNPSLLLDDTHFEPPWSFTS